MRPSLSDSVVDLPRNSQREVRANPCCGRLSVAGWFSDLPKTYTPIDQPQSSSIKLQWSDNTYRENKRDTTTHSLTSIKHSGIAQPEFLISLRILPADYGGAVEENFNRLAGWELRSDAGVVVGETRNGLRWHGWGFGEGWWWGFAG